MPPISAAPPIEGVKAVAQAYSDDVLVYHDSPYGKEPIALLQERAKRHGFEVRFLPVTHLGVEQKATWLHIRHPDYVLLWGWGVMNSTAIKEAVAVERRARAAQCERSDR